jgi:hypothetical protein
MSYWTRRKHAVPIDVRPWSCGQGPLEWNSMTPQGVSSIYTIRVLPKHRDAVFNAFPDVPQALDRFEGIFRDLNSILGEGAPGTPGSIASSKARNVA